MKKNVVKAIIAALVVAFCFSSCDFFGPVCEVQVVNGTPYINCAIDSISLYNKAGFPEVDEYEPTFKKGIITWQCLPGSYNASASVYSRKTGMKKLVLEVTCNDDNRNVTAELEVTALPSVIRAVLKLDEKGDYYIEVLNPAD